MPRVPIAVALAASKGQPFFSKTQGRRRCEAVARRIDSAMSHCVLRRLVSASEQPLVVVVASRARLIRCAATGELSL